MFYLISLFSLLFCFSVFISDYFLFLTFIFFSIPLLAVSKRLPLIVPQHTHTQTGIKMQLPCIVPIFQFRFCFSFVVAAIVCIQYLFV